MPSSWIESIDVNAYVEQLMKREVNQINKVTLNKTNQLNDTQSALKTRLSAYTQIQTLLDALQDKIESLTTTFNPTYQATSSNTDAATVSIDGTVTPGMHVLNVTQLAQAESVASGVFSSDNTALNMTNTVTISIGSDNIDIEITSDDTLQTIANKINLSASTNDLGAAASVISTGTGQYRLVISSTQSGTANQVNISETGTGSDALNISTGPGGTGTVLMTAADAQFELDGLSYTSSTNSNLIAGLNITLLGTGSNISISVTESNQISKVAAEVQNVVNAYNDIMVSIAKTKATNALPDSTLVMIQSNLKNLVSADTLTSLGIIPVPYNEVETFTITLPDGTIQTMYPTGMLKIADDPVTGETFETKLTANYANIKSQLVGTSGVFTELNSLLEPSTGDIWKILNDTQYGGIPLTKKQVDDLQEQIDGINDNADRLKEGLVMKYAKLDLLLGQLQVTSQYLSQQLLAMNNNK
ncbi:flagellar filament capping protein FliD [Aquicella lusitana]|uniref:Flagellar hook-associated protein 2 n=1 Tax=Aquicella lusitana TaxID=254246 RepID=A0A370G842_9COXI|nr:flagellar filament capping protein FliD [Aquicella lusitana]RDI39951.1 flagellar capping protein FliD [Aquicella lusitana]VVC74554.1 Flagellar hook-associated protein 2 [Aquicella lusitana]